jgi:hypothetical protein
MKFNRIALYAMLFTTLFLGGSFKAWADDFQDFKDNETYGIPSTTTHDFIKRRAYIGFFATSADIDGSNDFDGYNNFTSQPGGTGTNFETDYAPFITRNFGWAAMAGYREGAWAGEFSYWYSNHSAYVFNNSSGSAVTALSTSAVYTTINVDLKRYFFTTVPLQPFVDVGMNFAFLTSQNTSAVYDSNGNFLGSGSSTVSGFGLNLGVGAELYLGDGLSLVGGAIQRFTSWGGITGLEKQDGVPDFSGGGSSTPGALEGNGMNFYVGGTIGME